MLGIVQQFAEEGYEICPEALELIASYSGSKEDLIVRLIRDLDEFTKVISVYDVNKFISSTYPQATSSVDPSNSDSSSNFLGTSSTEFVPDDRSLSVPPLDENGGSLVGLSKADSIMDQIALADPRLGLKIAVSNELEVLSDITGQSTCEGEYDDFIRYFRDRYAKIKDMLSFRLNDRPIESLKKKTAGREVSIIGMVMDIRTSAKGNKVVELEDPTGMVLAIFKKGTPCFDDSVSLVMDEVIGVEGTIGGGGNMIFAESMIRPDLPLRSMSQTGDGGALLMSDLHVGSKYFVEDAWVRFISWINGEVTDPLGLASRVKYIVIAGDLVDGVGVYPGQENDLSIMDIRQQYRAAAELLADIPTNIQVIISPGNHDVVRQAEPQPALPDFVQDLFGNNFHFVGNPALFKLGGIDWLVYHGRSIDDLVLKIPGLSYGEPEKAMIEMLKRRHLSPIYGNRVSIAPEKEDLLVIQKPPAVLHCGHVHTVGVVRHKGVTVVNSGTWQGQTDFQKKMNIQPTPAIVPHLDLTTMRIRKLIFADE